MKKALLEKLKESLMSILPATVIILIVALVLQTPFYAEGVNNSILNFLICVVLLIAGLTLFTLGSQNSMLRIAENIGNAIAKKASVAFLVIVGFIIGILITITEPSLWVLGDQFQSIDTMVILIVVGVGVAIFLVIALLRIILQVKMRYLMLVSYGLIFIAVFIAAYFIPSFSNFIPFAFDSSGVTTGPMAVPFIISLGLGVSSSRNDKNAEEDSFGLVGIASIGPIVAVIILGLIIGDAGSGGSGAELNSYGAYFLKFFSEMGIAILPFIAFFIIFQIFFIKGNKKYVTQVLVGFVLVYLGLVLFMTGANIGFVAMGQMIGEKVADSNSILLIPLGMIFGFVIVSAEPSVIVLNQQVEEVTSGAISKKVMRVFMSIGMAISLGLAMLRIVTGINILWILAPVYVAAVVLAFFSPKLFTAIAFDSGGAVSGAMTSTFLAMMALGATKVIYPGDDAAILTQAFGLVAFVAMMPLLTLQILGVAYKFKQRRIVALVSDDEIIEFNV